MNKKFLIVAMVTAMILPMVASADAVLYGKVRVAVEAHDHADGSIDNVMIQGYGSRIGVKGSEKLANGLMAIYMLEFGVNISETTPNEFSGGNSITNRNAFVGLKGSWGTLKLGREDTPMKQSTGGMDYFEDQAGDYNSMITENFGDDTANGVVYYATPSMGGLTVLAALIPGENSQADGLADAYSVAAIYSSKGLKASASIQSGDDGLDDIRLRGVDQIRFGLSYKTDSWKVAGVWENQDGPLIDRDTYGVNLGYTFGNNLAKIKYFNVDGSHDGFAIGLDHNFSKRTQAYLVYVGSDYDNGNDVDIFGIGLNHSF